MAARGARDNLTSKIVEEVGVLLELEAAAPRMVGRVLGWLLVCEPPEQSAADLADYLQASKGSISTATRVLLRLGMIERVRTRGERFDRFRVRPGAYDEAIWRADQFTRPRLVLKMGMDALADEPPSRRERLEELDAMYAWWEKRIAALHEEYLADRDRRRKQRDTRGEK